VLTNFISALLSILKVSTYHSFMERRASPRKTVLMSGVLEFAGITINCLISNISISGAAIEIPSRHHIPERFRRGLRLVRGWIVSGRTMVYSAGGQLRIRCLRSLTTYFGP